MIIFPAVDIKGGKAVRLRRGRADDATVFADDPAEAARHWERLGARWLHVVDLDGAFEGHAASAAIVGRICGGTAIPVQLGGGIRDADAARAYLDAGVTRLIIGTMALEEPENFAALCRAWPGKIGVSLDAADGKLKSRGWVADTGLAVSDVLPRLEDAGAAFIIYTDIERDGMHSGVNADALARLVRAAHVPVIAAGGVSTLEDVRRLYPLAREGLEGVISGRALYEGTLDLPAALAWVEAREARA
ncbi:MULTISPECIES: 1-(5-phosphoribosyl)-5-[(5-phosphoribosylamino)methylideneamino]imidazole-4-carboxamide isomerase [unclassified Desulfovibrio]|uniref:1-(5-phosphoribosyl)-5-[(5- phosphoribosylamino)methylideneamino]imidazole-4- carboxamide isomerase n=1 Tax=unclassified Desulfovibrio TaxID=2593640 RepID=UPI0013EA54B1|nr:MULTISPECIES: 1-(5-phosphoribosyl)-5-[(5-phosphoribosylamino)methylideneamino]imidazole-4-carboxamide isomerase [unclassified Desulfovibrio]